MLNPDTLSHLNLIPDESPSSSPMTRIPELPCAIARRVVLRTPPFRQNRTQPVKVGAHLRATWAWDGGAPVM